MKGGHGCLMSGISGLSFDFPFRSPLSFYCLVILLFLSVFMLMVYSPDFFSPDFSVEHLGDVSW